LTLPPDEVRLLHIRDATESAADFITGRTRADLETDEMLRLALTKLVEIVGEAAKQLSDAGRARFPTIAWDDAARMRDRLVHHYFDVDLDVLWATVTQDLPALLDVLGPGLGPRKH
jgi:uncharacterized protein with HEPN domain